MGYTIYFSFRKAPKGQAKLVEELYQKAILDAQRFLVAYNAQFEPGDGFRLSGYSAHCRPGSYGGIKVNGTDSNSYEDLCLTEHFSQNENGFVKTNRRPYTAPVLAVLWILKKRLGSLIQVSTDGYDKDYQIEASRLLIKLTRYKKWPSLLTEHNEGGTYVSN